MVRLFVFGVFDNGHGGTYIGNVTVTYNVPGQTDKVTKTTSASGGETRTIDGIPLDVTNLDVTVSFEAGSKFYFRWPRPISTWLIGQRTIDMSGVWPWGSHAKLRPASTEIIT